MYCQCIVKPSFVPVQKLYLNTMYLIVLWPPVPILCVYIYCTYSACTCTYQGHMVCLCLFTYKSVKRHHIPVRQSLWNQTVLRKTPPIHRKYSISERAAERLHSHLNERAAESLHLHLKWVEHTKIKCDLSWTEVNPTTWKIKNHNRPLKQKETRRNS